MWIVYINIWAAIALVPIDWDAFQLVAHRYAPWKRDRERETLLGFLFYSIYAMHSHYFIIHCCAPRCPNYSFSLCMFLWAHKANCVSFLAIYFITWIPVIQAVFQNKYFLLCLQHSSAARSSHHVLKRCMQYTFLSSFGLLGNKSAIRLTIILQHNLHQIKYAVTVKGRECCFLRCEFEKHPF